MWTLKPVSRGVPTAERDQGAVLVIVAVMMVALLGMGAMVIDLGAVYVEKRQLQNGADAAALAVAQDCAGGDCADEAATAQEYADLNANDDRSAVDLVCGKGAGLTPCAAPAPAGAANATGWVRVATSTQTASGTEVDFVLAPVMDALAGATVHASAVAAWGSPGRAATIPLVLSACEYEYFGGIIPEGGGSATLPNLPATIYFHTSEEATPCPAGPSGGDAPGGFGWLAASSDCRATVTADGWVNVSTGVATPNSCQPIEWRNQDIVLAVFDDTNDRTGNNLQYHILGFVAIRLTGYAFTGTPVWSTDPKIKKAKDLCPAAPGGSGICLTGTFIEYSMRADGFGGPDLGARVIKMVG